MAPTLVMPNGPFGDPVPSGVSDLVRTLLSAAPSRPVGVDGATLDLAIAEGLGPALGLMVVSGAVLVPAPRRSAIVWEHQLCVAANLLREHVARRLVAIYQGREIPVLLLKGMALIQSILAPGERSMGDVDVLVPASRWREACHLLVEHGFSETKVPRRAFTTGHDYVRSFCTHDGVLLEVHRYICERGIFSIDHEGPTGLFARARKVEESGLFVPGDHDLFLTLAAHAAKHTFELPLRSFLDGIYLLQRRRLSMPILFQRAKAWRMNRALEAWIQALRMLDQTTRSPNAGPVPYRTLGKFVWSRTSHGPVWQRFARLAWLSDTKAYWARHVATRAGFRALDLIASLAVKDPD